MKATLRGRPRRWALMLAAALSGGSTFASCDTRIRQDLVAGTKNWIFSLFDPNLYLDSILLDSSDQNPDD